tara:strand:+ start:6108 stop:6452 length:345 start_codon:yes stop_codon:yes gene_type:complete
MMTREINWLARTYLDEVEKLEYWEFTKNLLGRVAYDSLYIAAREKGMTTEEAATFCTSKWIRHNEEVIGTLLVATMLDAMEKTTLWSGYWQVKREDDYNYDFDDDIYFEGGEEE